MNQELLTTLTWLIPAAPLLTFFLIVLFTNHNRTLSWVLGWAGVITAWVLGWIVAFNVAFLDIEVLAHQPLVLASSVPWLPFTQAVENWLRMGVAVDALTAIMLFMVPFTITMIFVYSVGYHNYGMIRGATIGTPNHGREEPLFSRFFAFMSLFAGGMLALVVADNLLLLFMGWEVMGLCSYLLVGFWYGRVYDPDPKDPHKLAPRWAAIKAFLVTRAGDVVMLLGIVGFYEVFGTLNFSQAFTAESLAAAVEVFGIAWLGTIALLLFSGTVGKSAQFPLHTWLPNAMEGPTPVSAVIHAAAMVSAGVYLIIRIFPLIAVGVEASPVVAWVIAGIGAFTAFMAATMALAQDDVKGVLAYSTISQLGFMVAAVGIGAYVAAAFHLIAHAFFKALLFLCAGSVIHGMEHGAEHAHDHHTDPQDMMYMGGLAAKMPITYWTFVIGGLALAGFPLVTAGFWSKDEILADAWFKATSGDAVAGLALLVFIVLAVAAFMTAFYTMRQIALTFIGRPRTELAEHAHESNWYMTLPLLGLAFFAITFGWIGIPEHFPVLGPLVNNNFFHHFVGTTVEETLHELHEAGLSAFEIHALPFHVVPLLTSLVVALGGLAAGWLVYARQPLRAEQPDPLVAWLGPLHGFLRNKWYINEVYQTLIIRPAVYFSEVVVYEWVDRGVIDGTLHLIARVFWGTGALMARFERAVISQGVDRVKDGVLSTAREFRTIQAGKIQEYALLSLLIAWVLTAVVLLINSGLLSDGIFGLF